MSAQRNDDLLTRIQWEKERRKIMQSGFIPYCNAFGYELATHHILMTESIEEAISQGGKNIMICMPPGHAKSRYASILFPSYFLGRFSGKSVIMATHTAELSAKWGRATRRLIETEKYHFLFNTTLSKDSKSSDRFDLSNGSEYFGCGIGGAVTGQRADVALIDDPVKSKEDADSETIREKTWDWYLNDLRTRLKPGAVIILIMTRWHEDDLAGRILTSPDRDKWNVLSLPAIAIENDVLGRSPGEALWPDYIPLSMLTDIRDSLDKEDIRMWNSLYQQNPTIEEGNYFKKEWIQLINKAPSGLIIYGASDYAVSLGKGDYTVHIIVGHDPVKDDIYILDIWRKKEESNVWIEAFIELCFTYKPIAWAEENGQILKSLEPFIKKEMERQKCFVYREQFTSATDKTIRGRAFQAFMAQKRVFILNADWTREFVKELLSFPDGKHDDQVDAAGLIGRMLDDMFMKKKDPRKKQKDDYRSNMILLPDLNESISNPKKDWFDKI